MVGALTSGACLALYLHGKEKQPTGHSISLLPQLRAFGKKEDKGHEKIPLREQRYKDFSSVQYNGQPYMTPRDFLESVTLDEPRRE